MPRLTRILVPVVACVIALPTAVPAQDRVLTMDDVSPDLARLIGGTELDFVQQAEIEYGVTGESRYDRFYRESAIAYGGFLVGRQLTDDATVNLKRYARSKAAVAELETEIQELTEGAPPEEWTTEQSIAVLRAAEAKDQLSDEERQYMITTAVHVAACLPVVEASMSSSRDLVEEAPDLVSGARSAFGLRRAGGAARNVQRSADRIKDIPSEGAGLLESLTVLSRGLSMVSGS